MQIISVRELENLLNADATNQAREITYDFLSNVPQEIPDVIETQPFAWSGDDLINAFPVLNANLSADKDLTIANTAIGHNGILETDFAQISSFQISSSQISTP